MIYRICLSSLFIALTGITVLAQKTAPIHLRMEVAACPTPLNMYEFNGMQFVPVEQARETEANVYTFEVPRGPLQFYYIGNHPKNVVPVILGQEDTVVVQGDCNSLRTASFARSDFNLGYQKIKANIDELNKDAQRLARRYQVTQGKGRTEIESEMKVLDSLKLQLLQDARAQHPYFGHVVALNTYLSYPNNPSGYPNEIEYYANEYFRYADFEDPTYNRLPWVYEAFRSYARTIASIPVPDEQRRVYIDSALAKIETGSGAHKLALSGVLNSLKQKNNANFTYFGQQFADAFRESEPAAVANLEQEMKRMENFTKGGEAPDFTQASPDGEDISLSDFRGSVVLVDFWASWCGPCRRENPNVVKLYEKYHDQGFDILGVSLDRDKKRWVKAIEQDELGWSHVSDLKGWQNEVAQLYGVRSIPHTVLLDREGKIIARNLRGEALERKLAEIFE